MFVMFSYRASCSSNYRQLQIMRGVRAVEETEEERMDRERTRSEALMWYRSGGHLAVEDDERLPPGLSLIDDQRPCGHRDLVAGASNLLELLLTAGAEQLDVAQCLEVLLLAGH